MSGFCSAHKHHEPGCKQCEADSWGEVHEIFLHIGEALMSIGTHRNMSEDWYAMVERMVDRGVEIAHRVKQ